MQQISPAKSSASQFYTFWRIFNKLSSHKMISDALMGGLTSKAKVNFYVHQYNPKILRGI